MKKKIKITDKQSGKTTEGEIELRNTLHFLIQKNTRAQVFKAKNGKGSYTRKQKHKK